MKSRNMDFILRKALKLYYHFGVYTKSGKYPIVLNSFSKYLSSAYMLFFSEAVKSEKIHSRSFLLYPIRIYDAFSCLKTFDTKESNCIGVIICLSFKISHLLGEMRYFLLPLITRSKNQFCQVF